MKKLMISAAICAAIVSGVFAEGTPDGCAAETAKEARDRAGREAMERKVAEKKAREERAKAESEAYQRAKEERADQKAAARKGMTVEAYRLDRDTKDAKRAGVSLEAWQAMDKKARSEALREAGIREALERDTKAAEKTGLSVEDYRLQRDAKHAGCTLEEWKTLDESARRAKRKEADAKKFLEYEQRDAAKAGLSLEEFRAQRDAKRKAKQEADEAERKALREKIHADFEPKN